MIIHTGEPVSKMGNPEFQGNLEKWSKIDDFGVSGCHSGVEFPLYVGTIQKRNYNSFFELVRCSIEHRTETSAIADVSNENLTNVRFS